jgi:hypothetical protein
MACKVTFFFEQVGSGWSETWYHATNDPKSLIKTVIDQQVLKRAVDFRHPLTYLKAARATKLEGNKESFTASYGADYHGLGAGLVEVGPDVVSADAVLKVEAQQQGAKRMFIRGLNDEDIRRNATGKDMPSGALQAGLTNYLNIMAQRAFCIQKVTNPPTGGIVWVNVTSVKAVAGVPTQVDVKTTEDVVAPIAVGQRVRFSRVPSDTLPGFPPNAVVLAVNPLGVPGVRISYGLRGGAEVFPPSMRVIHLAFEYQVIGGVAVGFFSLIANKLNIERFSAHKTGRPFGLLRGRARAKVRAH